MLLNFEGCAWCLLQWVTQLVVNFVVRLPVVSQSVENDRNVLNSSCAVFLLTKCSFIDFVLQISLSLLKCLQLFVQVFKISRVWLIHLIKQILHVVSWKLVFYCFDRLFFLLQDITLNFLTRSCHFRFLHLLLLLGWSYHNLLNWLLQWFFRWFFKRLHDCLLFNFFFYFCLCLSVLNFGES